MIQLLHNLSKCQQMFCGNLAVGVHDFTISSSFFYYAACPVTQQQNRIGTYGSPMPMQSFGFKYLSWNSWKLRWHWVWAKNVHCKRDFHTGNSCQVCHRVQGYGWQHLKLVCRVCLRYASHSCSAKLQQSLVWKSEWKVGNYRFHLVPFLRATGHLANQIVFIWCFWKPLSAHS